MLTEIVIFPIPEAMPRNEVIELFEKSAPGWQANPDLIHKSYLYDPEGLRGGGVYLWKNRQAAKEAHNDAWCARITGLFGPPKFDYFETPVVVDNSND